MALSDVTKIRRCELIDTSKVGDRVVLYHRDRQTAIVLNPTGARIWELLAQPRGVQELTEHLVDDFSSSQPDQVAQDVTSFLTELLDQGGVVAED